MPICLILLKTLNAKAKPHVLSAKRSVWASTELMAPVVLSLDHSALRVTKNADLTTEKC